MRMRRLVVGLLAAVITCGVVSPVASAAPSARQRQIDQQKRVLNEKIKAADARAKTLGQELAESAARRATLEKQSADLAARLAQAQKRLAAAEAELGVARADLVHVEGGLATALSRADDLREQMDTRSRMVYASGGAGSYVSMLLGASDIRDLVSRLTYVRKVIASDRERADQMQALAAQLETDRAAVLARRDDIQDRKSAIEVETANIAQLQAAVKANREQVAAAIASHQNLLNRVKSDKAGYLREMARLEAESRSIASLLRSRQKGQVFQAGSGARLAWPTTGRVTSSYGHRTHPVFGDRRMHAGIDIGAPTGQAIIASEAGTVIWTGPKGGYGNTVIIDHGDALATLYAHMSAISVRNGAHVARGARIGSVGCTGYCTGPHLHFETRVNGEPVDPMRFF